LVNSYVNFFIKLTLDSTRTKKGVFVVGGWSKCILYQKLRPITFLKALKQGEVISHKQTCREMTKLIDGGLFFKVKLNRSHEKKPFSFWSNCLFFEFCLGFKIVQKSDH